MSYLDDAQDAQGTHIDLRNAVALVSAIVLLLLGAVDVYGRPPRGAAHVTWPSSRPVP